MDLSFVKGFPFNLDVDAFRWLETTFAAMDSDAKLGQVLLPPLPRSLAGGPRPGPALPGWRHPSHSFPHTVEQLRDSGACLQSQARIPLLVTTDIEFSEKSSLASGTPFPNPLAVAATGDTEWARRQGQVTAREGGACGFNLTWTPVVDLDLNHRNAVVNTLLWRRPRQGHRLGDGVW